MGRAAQSGWLFSTSVLVVALTAACGSDDNGAGGGGAAAGGPGLAGGAGSAGTAGTAGAAGAAASGGAAGAGGVVPQNCKPIVIDFLSPAEPPLGHILVSGYTCKKASDDCAGDPQLRDKFQIELYEGQTTGTFDLSTGVDANFSTCVRCIRVLEDLDPQSTPKKYYFQASGTLTLTDVDPNPTPASAGSLQNVVLVEVTLDPSTHKSTPVAGGECLVVESADWNSSSNNDTLCARKNEGCFGCCYDYHPQGAATIVDAQKECVCTDAVCKGACATTACANPYSEPDDLCIACVDPEIQQGGACYDAIQGACVSVPDCATLLACTATCPD